MQNVLEYTGSKVDRQTIRKYEFHYSSAKTQALKFDVLLVGPLHPGRQASRTNIPVKNMSLLSVQHMLPLLLTCCSGMRSCRLLEPSAGDMLLCL